jgi:DNA repair ATPase RecN
MIKKTKKIVDETEMSSKDLFEMINEEATLRKMTMSEACMFLKSKGFKLSLDDDGKTSNLRAAYDFLHNYKKLDDYSLDDLVKWRQTVRERLFQNKKQIETLEKECDDYVDNYSKQSNSLRIKRQKDMKWFDDVSKVIANKIKGMKTVEDMSIE